MTGNFYSIGIGILSEHITFKQKTMFTKLNDILQEGDTAKMVVTRTKTGLSVTILPVLKEDKEGTLLPVTASGTAEELDAQLLEEFGKALPEVRQTVIDVNSMVAAAKEKKAEEEKKAKEDKKAKDAKKSTPAPKVKGSVKEDEDKEDEDEDTDGDDSKEEPVKEKPAPEPPKPVLTAAQKKAISDVEGLFARAQNTKDEDMIEYLQKNAIKALTAADLATVDWNEKFTNRLNEVLTAQTQEA
jgi:PRTRC genetic system protein E